MTVNITSWKTTTVGLIVIAVGIVHCVFAHKLDAEGTGMMSAGVGLIMAKDNDK